jgi:hypothetical protein
MLIFILGIAMSIGLWVGVYLGFKERYNANEGTLALLVLETFCVSLALIIYGLIQVIHGA